AGGAGGPPPLPAARRRALPIPHPAARRAPRRVRCFGSSPPGRADMDEPRGVWHSLGLLLQAAWPTVLLLLVCITYVVAAVRYARTQPRWGPTRAVRPSADRQRRL